MESAPLPPRISTLVVGAGLTGLAAARTLASAGEDVHVVEASDAVGGRVRTDEVDGFLLDRGFQVLLTAYDEVRAQVDLEALELQAFQPGSLVWTGAKMERLADPWRAPGAALPSLMASVGSLGDKLKVASLRRRVVAMSVEECFSGPDRTTQEELEALGFSAHFIDTFFRPFLGGVFLERGLETSARLFRYYFRCFSTGQATVPARGMQCLPELLAAPLEGRITLKAPVVALREGVVEVEGGGQVQADRVVIAADGAAAAGLTGDEAPDYKATVTSYFAASRAPTRAPLLVLDGEGTGPANHVAVMSNVAPGYAPAGSHLISVSGVDEAANDPDGFSRSARVQLRRWFGGDVDEWRHLRTYHIPHALPRHPGGAFDLSLEPRRVRDGVWAAGDYLAFGALQGALLAGRRAGEAVLKSS